MHPPLGFQLLHQLILFWLAPFRRAARRERLRRKWARQIARALFPEPACGWLIDTAAQVVAAGIVPADAFGQLLRDVRILRANNLLNPRGGAYFFELAVRDLCARSGVDWPRPDDIAPFKPDCKLKIEN